MPGINVYRAAAEVESRFSRDGFRAVVARSTQPGETVFEHFQDVHRVFVTLEGRTRATVAETDREPTVRRPDRAGVVTVVPAGVPRRVRLEDIDFLVLDLSVTDGFLGHCVDDDGMVGVPALVQNVRDDWLMRAGRRFREASAGGASALELETLALAIGRHLLRRRNGAGGGLDPTALARVVALMHERLADDLSLADLAGVAGLGISAFGRAFARSVGMPPYRHFAALRMARARELLARSRMSLAEIAVETGFSDQAHFTAAFTRHVGMPPGRWRREAGGVPSIVPISRKTGMRAAP